MCLSAIIFIMDLESMVKACLANPFSSIRLYFGDDFGDRVMWGGVVEQLMTGAFFSCEHTTQLPAAITLSCSSSIQDRQPCEMRLEYHPATKRMDAHWAVVVSQRKPTDWDVFYSIEPCSCISAKLARLVAIPDTRVDFLSAGSEIAYELTLALDMKIATATVGADLLVQERMERAEQELSEALEQTRQHLRCGKAVITNSNKAPPVEHRTIVMLPTGESKIDVSVFCVDDRGKSVLGSAFIRAC